MGTLVRALPYALILAAIASAAGCGGRTTVYDGAWDVVVAPASEPGPRLEVAGVIRDAAGRPLPLARVRVYHSDVHGEYFATGSGNTPRLHREFRAGSQGEYRIHTIVPRFEAGGEPPHLHFEIAPARGGPARPAVLYLMLEGRTRWPAPGPPSLRPQPGLAPDSAWRELLQRSAPAPPGAPGVPPMARRGKDGVWRARADVWIR